MLNFLYTTAVGRILLRPLTSRSVSRICGRFISSPASKRYIKPFIKKHHIDLSEYERHNYRCFNDFFTRKILPSARPIDNDPQSLISPCDGLLSAYRINEESIFHIKESEYDVSSLLGDLVLSRHFLGGTCLIFRLCVNHYHRYHYIDDGTKGENHYLPGVLHTVRPIALEHKAVYLQNCREWTMMNTKHFGNVAQIEVGALLVGKIQNYHGAGRIHRGDEKGKFLYGGSTVILLFEPDKVKIPEKYFHITANGHEIPVKMGQKIGYSTKKC